MTRSTPRKVSTLTTSIPPHILNNYPTLQLYIDFVYINKQPFLHTKSSHIKFLTIQHAINRTQGTIKRLLISTIDKYHSRGFTITDIFGDNEFDVASLHEFFRPITIHICAPEEHVPQIERQNRTTKERLRTICHSLPYKRYTKLMTIHLAEYANHWENAFPSPSGVSTTISPASIVEGRKKPDFNHQHLAFGTYALIYIGTKNNLKARSVPAIALKPSNDWGGFYFMSLITGKRLHAFKWTELPINEEVIERIDDLARKENQPILSNGTVLIEWNIENESGSSEQYETALEVEEPPPAESDIVTHNDEVQNSVENETLERIEEHMNEAMIAVNEENDSTILEDCNDHHLVNDSNDFFENDELSLDSDDESEERLFVPDQVTNESTPRRALTNVRSTSLLPTQDTSTENDPEPTENINIEEDTQQVPEGPFLRSERPRRLAAMRGIDRMEPTLGGKEHISYRRKLGLLQKRQERLTHRAQVCLMMRRIRRETHSEKQFTQVMTNVTFLSAQMSAKQGFKKFGERAIMAMLKECEQLDRGAFPGKPVVEPMYLNDLTDLERRAAMTVVSLIKEKRCGKLKGRMCANGSTQKRYLQPEESITSPTVSNEGLLSTFVIDAYEGRNIAVVDIPGAYLHAGVNHDKRRVIIKLQDEFVDMMCQVNEKYKAYVCYEKGRKTLYLKLLRALYGCIESALLWYELFTSTLKNMGFSLNPYDKCIANKIINGSQCTIVWYVDDAKISHIDESVIKNIVKCLENKFGKLNPTYGNKQEYLGMKITIDDSRRLHIDMRDQICEVLDDFSESIAGNVSTPAAKHLMDVDPNSVPLYKAKADEFHSTTAKLLYLEKRGRPDIETAISFLTTRVSEPDEHDWRKLKRVLSFLAKTKDEVRIIGCDSLNNLFTWIDAAYAVHYNMRSHTGGVMSLGWGTLHAKSSKQKLNTKSSTEAEVVGMSEYVPYNIWLVNFLKSQGYEIQQNIIYQDNQSAIRMERNGRNSCTGNSRHIDVRYFFVKDRIDKGEMCVEYCPTHEMLADYYTKPLQGSLFKKLRNVIMGFDHISTLKNKVTPSLTMKERIEKRDEKQVIISNGKDKNGTGYQCNKIVNKWKSTKEEITLPLKAEDEGENTSFTKSSKRVKFQ